MSFIDGFWHLLNFFGPAIGLALIAPSLVKLLWRRDLKSVRWLRLCVWVFATGAAVSIAGLVALGHDGKMATYAAMVVVSALTLWWVGFMSRSR